VPIAVPGLDVAGPNADNGSMTQAPDYLTTRELAELLRIKERKVYDMAADGTVPCVRVVGKLLFPRAEIDAWLAEGRSGPRGAPRALPPITVGSHDPLLEWALRESQSGLAAFFDGSLDGLDRLIAGDAVACATHIHDSGGWNTATVAARAGDLPVVLLELARRQRGLVTPAGNPRHLTGIADLAGLRVVRRQSGAASQSLFESLCRDEGLDPAGLPGPDVTARTEDEAALLVHDGRADAAFALCSMAQRLGLGFVPILEERLDLLLWRHAYFEPPVQRLMRFLGGAETRARAAELGGYDLRGVGAVQLNGAGP
jgi:excisionase family DNA binding protein